MRIILDEDTRIDAGDCVLAAPDVFDQRDEDGIAILLDETPGDEARTAVDEAAVRCPALAIRVEGRPARPCRWADRPARADR